ncbi:MAG: hypothetical protein OCC49_15970 [Fibrobacterales bacterium]
MKYFVPLSLLFFLICIAACGNTATTPTDLSVSSSVIASSAVVSSSANSSSATNTQSSPLSSATLTISSSQTAPQISTRSSNNKALSSQTTQHTTSPNQNNHDGELPKPGANNPVIVADSVTYPTEKLALVRTSDPSCSDDVYLTCVTPYEHRYEHIPPITYLYLNSCHSDADSMVSVTDRYCAQEYCALFNPTPVPNCNQGDTTIVEYSYWGCVEKARCIKKPVCQDDRFCNLPEPLANHFDSDIRVTINDRSWYWTEELDEDTEEPRVPLYWELKDDGDFYRQIGKFPIDVLPSHIENMHHTITSIAAYKTVVEVVLGEPEIECDSISASFGVSFTVECRIIDFNNRTYPTKYASLSWDYDGDGSIDTLIERPHIYDNNKSEAQNLFTFFYPYEERDRIITPILTLVDDDSNRVSDTLSITMKNHPPEVRNPHFSGSAYKGATLVAQFDYYDLLNDPEGEHHYQWLRDGITISGETDKVYTITQEDLGTVELSVDILAVSNKGTPSADSATRVSLPYIADWESFADSRNGNEYEAVKIGSYFWMRQNLDYRGGDHKCYDDDMALCDTYGALYSESVAKTVCPTGWELPSRSDFKNLEDAIKAAAKVTLYPDVHAHLKTSDGWSPFGGDDSLDVQGKDTWGVSITPAGYYNENYGYSTQGTMFSMWLNEPPATFSRYTDIWVDFSGELPASEEPYNNYLSVRCIRRP